MVFRAYYSEKELKIVIQQRIENVDYCVVAQSGEHPVDMPGGRWFESNQHTSYYIQESDQFLVVRLIRQYKVRMRVVSCGAYLIKTVREIVWYHE